MIIGEDLFEGHSWTVGVVLLSTVGVGLLSCVCAVFDPHLPTGHVHVTRGCTAAKRHDFEKHAKRDHQPRERDDVDSLTVFWRSAGAAGDVERAEVVSEVGTVLAARCQHE